ncbi:MAG TPA: diguanylate cyclase [Solirubrobacterales bacterium]|jgi:two-component system cell cycle response regulator|nr:diguanylate cyclase [Solirubrobacterales bacterium]
MKVLAVDDSAAYRRLLEKAVTSLGHDCIVAEDGIRAWELFQSGGADVVISNWLMPGIEGDELCRMVRESDQPYAYFILFSAREGKGNIMHGMEVGADDYLAKPLDEDELEASLVAAERITSLYRKLGKQRGELERLNRDLYAQSRQDPLTGLGNRLRMQEDLKTLEGGFERYGHSYAVGLCDIDRFKAYNDSRGHLAGDEILRRVADTLRQSARSGDTVYRYGGEELLVVFRGQSVELAAAAAERMRRAVEALGIPHPGRGPSALVTISIGVAVRKGQPGGGEEVLREADEALYRAKDEGRNRVVVHESAS